MEKKLKFFRDKKNNLHYKVYIKGQLCNIYLDTNLEVNRTIFKDCYNIIKSLGIDITDLERKLIQLNMFGQNDTELIYHY